MAVKLYLISSLVAVLVICVTADLPTEGNDVLDSNVELGSFDSDLVLQDNIEEIEDVRQKREAIADPKKKNSNDRPRKKKSSKKGKGRKSNKETNKIKKGGKKSKKKTQTNRKQKSKKGKKKGKGKSASRKSKKVNRKSKKGGNQPNKKKRKGNKKGNKKSDNSRRKSKKGTKEKKRKGNKKEKKNSDDKRRKAKKVAKKSKKGGDSSKRNKKKSDRRKSKKGSKGGKNENEARKIKLDKKKSKKGGSKSNSGKTKGVRKSAARATVNLTCLRDAVTYTKFLKDNVVNFLRRNTRLTAQTKTTNKKAGKKGEFKEPAARLIQAGGGDKTNLSCSGSTTNEGAKKIKAVTDILDACEISIKKQCKPPSIINTTTLDTCKKNGIAFNTTVSACIVKATKGQDACSCFQAAEVAKEKKVLESCKGTKEAKAAAKARTACLKEITKCKNASTQASTLQYACSYSTDKLLKTLKQLTANLAAFKGLIDKVKELTGLSPTVGPQASNSTTGRQARSEEENEEEAIFDSHQARLRGKRQQQACSTITATITTCTTVISNKPASIDVTTSCKTPTYTIQTCTDADKTAITAALNDAVDKNAIIIAFIASLNSELKVVTGTTPKSSTLTDTDKPGSTGKASGRSRSVLRKMIMEKMNLRT